MAGPRPRSSSERIQARWWADALFGAYTVYLVVYIVATWLAQGWPQPQIERLAILAFAPVDAVVGTLAWLASRRLAPGSRGRLVWMLLAAACACSTVIDLNWVYYNLSHGTG